MDISRRSVSAGLLGLSALPSRGLAAMPGRPKLVLVILRGAMDGLHALAPVDDPGYLRARPDLALGGRDAARPGLPVASGLVLHPALRPLMPLYRAGQLTLLPGAGLAYRGRSHFEAQNLLETAAGRPHALRGAWSRTDAQLKRAGAAVRLVAERAQVPNNTNDCKTCVAIVCIFAHGQVQSR